MDWEFINKYRIGICVVLVILSLIFIMIGHVYQKEIQEKLKVKFFTFPGADIDWWSVSHFGLFMIFGFLIPEYPLTFFMIGGAFELLEDYLSANQNTQLYDCIKDKNGWWCGGIQDDYWYMNPTDPWVNLTGYIIGSAIRTTCVTGDTKSEKITE